MSRFVPLLARNEELNRWLGENPLALAAIFGALAALLLFIGIRNMLTGKAMGKWGTQHEGGMALFLGGTRIVGGIVCVAVALYGVFKAMF